VIEKIEHHQPALEGGSEVAFVVLADGLYGKEGVCGSSPQEGFSG